MKTLILTCSILLLILLNACKSETPLPEGVEGEMIGRWNIDSTRCEDLNGNGIFLQPGNNGSYKQFRANHTVVDHNPNAPANFQNTTYNWKLLPGDSMIVFSGTNFRTGLAFSDTAIIRSLTANRFRFQQVSLPDPNFPAACYYTEWYLSR